MGTGRRVNVAVLIMLQCFYMDFGATMDAITTSQFIKDPEALVSPGNVFKLGFFSPVNSSNRYVGIWYNEVSVVTPIWVANRNKPLNDSSGILKVSEDGNLVVLNRQKEILWSSNVSNGGVGNATAQLTDDGNLVLLDTVNGNSIWESFKQPINIFAKEMRLTTNERTGEKTMLTSWKGPSDPSIGSFSAAIEPPGIPQAFVWNGTLRYWRSGPWNGRNFIGIPSMNSVYLYGFTLARDGNGIFSLSYTYADSSVLQTMVLSSEGQLVRQYWVNSTRSWEKIWQSRGTECDVYDTCGSFGVCDPKNSPICSCLRGFEPKNADEWAAGDWTSGCVRRRSLQCEMGKEDGFLRLKTIKVPDFAHWSNSLEQECREACLNNCSCLAYSYYIDLGCMWWTGNLTDIQQFSYGGADLYIRLENSELDKKKNIKVITSMTVVSGAIVLFTCAFLLWRWMIKHKEWKKKNLEKVIIRKNENQSSFPNVELQELPVFDLQMLANATDNFDTKCKLGQGGFGPVYRGKLPDGQEIAVKRLSRASGQGLEECMNEVVVISKLQHRNLVRILGCCVEGEEKMLVYEYMPNRSLDSFIFDAQKKEFLDWRKRFDIVEGICRGLLYLHRDSRLRIIHRDVKASNILLDQDLNPKISDFGLAKIFGGNEDQVNTRRVVGTYGYMSPEYAMEGRFSEKSDVYSLGILLLEIVSGRRNTSFNENKQTLSLLQSAWKLWNEGNTAALVDPILWDPSFEGEMHRCMHVSLLCVQELAADRPNVSTVLSMLKSEILDLPSPKQPLYAESKVGLNSDSSSSVNMVTITVTNGR